METESKKTISTIKEERVFKLNEKKSTFTAYSFKITNEEEIKEKLQFVRKNHKDASHFPYAVRITNVKTNGSKTIIETIERYSDDGEPNKTAGYPIFKLLQNQDLSNILIIVARTFGGIKLGPAGLMKAFSGAAQEALNETSIETIEITVEKTINTTIQNLAKIEIFLKQNKIYFEKTFENSSVKIKIKIPLSKESILSEIERMK